jgi:hypothetical protein
MSGSGRGTAMPMNYNERKYWAEGSDLTEVEKIQMAKDLRELESRGVIQFRSGRWELAAGAEIEERSDALQSNSAEKEEGR